MRVLVLGAYGFIGREIGRGLIERGHAVIGLGRRADIGRRVLPAADWIERDLNDMVGVKHWLPLLKGVEAVVNASGGLQDDARDRLARTQGDAIVALIDAGVLAGVARFIQISAPGAHFEADTGFMRTKAIADSHLRATPLDWTILRPGLVIGRNAYGGTKLVRMLAALPIALSVHGKQPVRCVAMADVAAIAIEAVEGRGAARREIALVEPRSHSLAEVIALHRRALGFPPARATIDLPPRLARPISMLADLASLLGWRSPLRSTALKVLARGVGADGAPADRALTSLPEILAGLSLGQQDRWAARLAVLLPAIILSLALLWIGSGVIGLLTSRRAAALLGGSMMAHTLTRFCAVGDIVLGLTILWRPWARFAALGMAVAAADYLLGGTVLAPTLWSDPLGPLLRIVPLLVLALVAAALLDER